MNKFIVTGNIVKDASKGDKMSRTSIAVRRDFKNEKGEYDTDFFDLVAFGHQAEFINKYVNKGDKVEIVGRMQVRQYTTQDGITRKAYEVIIESISILTKVNKQEELELDDSELDFEDIDDEIPF